MKKIIKYTFLLGGAIFLVAINFLTAKVEPFPFSGEYKQDELIVRFKDTEKANTSLKALGIDPAVVTKNGVFKVKIKEGETIDGLYRALKANPDISYVEPNFKVKIAATPNDTYYGSQWALPKISAPAGWDKTQGSTNTKIAVLDTGIDYSHEDLSAKVYTNTGEINNNSIDDDGNGYIDDHQGFDFYNGVLQNPAQPFNPATNKWINDANSATDDHAHGTCVAGIAAAVSNNSIGVAGIDWNAKIVPLKVLASDGTGWVSDIAAAIEYAADNNISIVNMSLGTYDFSQSLEDMVDYAYNQGVVLAAAAGNDDINSILYPAKFSNVLAIGATNSSDQRITKAGTSGIWGSNYGAELDVTAPGIDIYTTDRTGAPGYGSGNYISGFGGTSGATPHVSGTAALVKAMFPSWTNSQIYDRIRTSVNDLGSSGFDQYYGYGRLNTNQALSPQLLVRETNSPTVYLINGSNKLPISDESTFYAYGFSFSNVAVVSQATIDAYVTGSILSLVAQDSGGNRFLMNNGQKLPMENSIYTAWGITAVVVPDSLLSSKVTGTNVTQIAKGENPTIYYVDGTKKRALSYDSFIGWGWGWGNITYVSDFTMSKVSAGALLLPPVSGFQIPGSATIYLTDWSKRWPIPNLETMSAWGLSWGSVYSLSQADADSYYPASGSNLQIFSYDGTNRYLLDSGKRFSVSGASYTAWGSPASSTVDYRILEKRPSSGNLSLGVKGSSATVYYIAGGQKRPLPGLLEFQSLGLSWGNISYLSDYSLSESIIPTGSPYYASGRFVQKSGSPTIYMIDGNNKWGMPDPDTYFAFGGTWTNYVVVSSDIDTYYPTNVGTITTIIQGTGPSVYYVDSGKKLGFSSEDVFLSWFDWGQITTVSDSLLANLPSGFTMTKVAKSNNSATIYFIDSKTKSAVTSIDAFLGCGLSWGQVNTFTPFALRDALIPQGSVFQCGTLEGVPLPASSGKTAWEQHLSLSGPAEPAGTHYSISGTPPAAQNGMAWETSSPPGYGAWGVAPPVADERYYINMRWNYTSLHGQPIYASKDWYYKKKVVVTNPANGKRVVASIVEYGPSIMSRVSGLSPEAMLAIGAVTDNNLTYSWLADQSSGLLGPI